MKITINGESFDFDGSKKPMSEALAIEKAWGRRYAEWEQELAAGSAEALCVFAWIVWRRDGRDVDLADILEGKADFDFGEFMRSLNAGAAAEEGEAEPGPPIPGVSSAPDGTAMTGTATLPSSPASSTSARGKSSSSKSGTSKP